MPDTEIRCSDCIFFIPKKFKGCKPGTIGTCHRHPPLPVFDAGEMKKDHSQRLTVANYWCGEFAPKPKPKEEECPPASEVH